MSNDDFPCTTRELIGALRGEPDHCDFCEKPITDPDDAIPEEGGMWACRDCWERFEEQDRLERAKLEAGGNIG